MVCISVVWPRKVALTNMPRRMIPGFCNFDSNLGGADVGIEDRADVADPSLEHPSGYAFSVISAVSPSWTVARSFSYTSQTTQMDERSEMVNG